MLAAGEELMAAASPFAQAFDAFFYKRSRGPSSSIPASSLGAALTLACIALLTLLGVLECVSYATPTLAQTVTLASAGLTADAAPLRVWMNVSFPAMPCHLLTLDASDVLSHARVNVSKNLFKLRYIPSSGRVMDALPDDTLVITYGVPPPPARHAAAEQEAVLSQGQAAVEPVNLKVDNLESFLAGTEAALVAFGAPWCPWSRRLQPVWEGLARVVSSVPHVRIGRVDCTDAAAAPLCIEAHINAFPTIVLYKAGARHSHSHYHGNRTEEALLSFLVLAMQDSDLTTAATDGGRAAHGDGEGHAHVERLVAEAAWLSEHPGGDVAAAAAAVGDDHHHGVDPADPGPALRLIEAIHKAGLTAPGDALRAAATVATQSGNGSADGACAPPAAGNGSDSGAGAAADAPPALALDEGCFMVGFVDVERVPGRLRIHPGGAEGMSLNKDALNMSHIVHDFSFGPRLTRYQLSRLPAGVESELHRLAGRTFRSQEARVAHTHYINVVEATFAFLTGHTVSSFKYTAHSNSAVAASPVPPGGVALPSAPMMGKAPEVLFKYELSPVAMHTQEVRKPLYAFLTSLCAIIGGVFTVVSLMDSVLHASLRSFRVKAGIGKLQ